jgi:anthranilate/para-aminobenzoate synthase component II
MIMSIDNTDSTTYYMASDMESLSQLLQVAEQGSPLSAGTLQLHFYRMGNGSVTWLLKNQTGVLF